MSFYSQYLFPKFILKKNKIYILQIIQGQNIKYKKIFTYKGDENSDYFNGY